MDVITVDRRTYQRSASGITVLAHLLGLTALVLMLIWLLHYREGLDLDSENPIRVFNVHPFLMYFGFIFFAAEAMMAYKTVAATHKVQKFVHMFFNLVSLVLGIVGIHAAFKYHDKLNLEDMTSLHSWIGMAALCLFILQWLFGFSLFLFPQASTAYTRAQALPWHINGGRALLYMAICAAETGLMQKSTFLQLKDGRESHLVNILAVVILLFGITVDISVALARYV
ncbi:putative transmembrane ascorbate ferrireductase 3 [Heracleum sosnowskyi]|uniref:ascorbate ferrireductase (transmembrane) n=1 Tax=Heracleum sosnowskyi TaxID=360622 RepID=A0AAD8MUM4_9APIA|nr:putative transmembrane ascorbate ferrireductase 3 [Heracleum sosnowskyi]